MLVKYHTFKNMYEGIQKQTYDAGYPIYPHFGREGGKNFQQSRLLKVAR